MECSGFEEFVVAPTASGRTVHALREPPLQLKLHYNGTIGRLNRSIGIKEASYAVHTSATIRDLILARQIGPRFAILPEEYARVLVGNEAGRAAEIGLVHRSVTPRCCGEPPHALIPAFSLFSADTRALSDDTLLTQLFRASKMSATEFMSEQLLFPLVDSYFALLLRAGLQGECHAQNMVFGIDSDGLIQSVILRDMESVDTDRDLRRFLGLRLAEPPSLHKAMNKSQKNYQIKHSFMFDFKLCEYLIAPLIDAAVRVGHVRSGALDVIVRDRVMAYLRQLPVDFLPDGCWYGFERVQIDRSTSERPYERHENPRFRATL